MLRKSGKLRRALRPAMPKIRCRCGDAERAEATRPPISSHYDDALPESLALPPSNHLGLASLGRPDLTQISILFLSCRNFVTLASDVMSNV